MLPQNLHIRLVAELEVDFQVAGVDLLFEEVEVEEDCGGAEVVRPVICCFRGVFEFILVKLKSCPAHVG